MLYDILEVLHIFAVVAWFSGLFYLPRLYVYHAEAESGGEAARMLQKMEYRLLYFIMTPAMLLVWGLGLSLMLLGDWYIAGWLHVKLLLVLALTGLQGYFSLCRKRLVAGSDTRSARHYRIVNEIPTVILLVILFLVVFRPF